MTVLPITKEERELCRKHFMPGVMREGLCAGERFSGSVLQAYEAALTAAEGDIARLKDDLASADRATSERIAELCAEIERLREENLRLENLQPYGVHTCSPNCKQPMCILRRERDALREALRPFVNLVAKDEEGQPSDELEGLPDGHAFDVAWRMDGTGNKSPWVSAGQFRRARAALKGE